MRADQNSKSLQILNYTMGGSEKNLHLLATIQFNGMSFLLQIVDDNQQLWLTKRSARARNLFTSMAYFMCDDVSNE